MTQDIHSTLHEHAAASPSPGKQPTKEPKKSRPQSTAIDWLAEPYNQARGETSLWVAVITQAMMDALSKSKNPEMKYHKYEAIRWLSDNSKDFTMVCYFANMDPDYVRRKAKQSLLQPTPWRAEAGKGKRYLERKSYRGKKQPPPPTPPQPPEGQIIAGPWPKDHSNAL